jgi:hypothetical protein
MKYETPKIKKLDWPPESEDEIIEIEALMKQASHNTVICGPPGGQGGSS